MTTFNYNRLNKEAGWPLLIGGALLTYLAHKKVKDLMRDLPNRKLYNDIIIDTPVIDSSIKSAMLHKYAFKIPFRNIFRKTPRATPNLNPPLQNQVPGSTFKERWSNFNEQWKENLAANAEHIRELERLGYIQPMTGVFRWPGYLFRGISIGADWLNRIPDALFRKGTLLRLIGKGLYNTAAAPFSLLRHGARFINNAGKQINIGLYGADKVLENERLRLARQEYNKTHPGWLRRLFGANEEFTDATKFNKQGSYMPYMNKKASKSRYKYDTYVDTDADEYLLKQAIANYPYLQ